MNEKYQARAAMLKSEGCPIQLADPTSLYARLTDWLDRVGQEDGRWSDGAEIRGMLDGDHPVAKAMAGKVIDGWSPAVSKRLAERLNLAMRAPHHVSADGLAHDLCWMSATIGVEFCAGWSVFGVHAWDAGDIIWCVAGCLFPSMDEVPGEGIRAMFLAEEIFPVEDEGAETANSKERDRAISADIARLKRDIADTAERYGMDAQAFEMLM